MSCIIRVWTDSQNTLSHLLVGPRYTLHRHPGCCGIGTQIGPCVSCKSHSLIRRRLCLSGPSWNGGVQPFCAICR